MVWIGDKQGRVWASAARDARCVCVMGDPAEPMTAADRDNMRLILAAGPLLKAAEKLLDGLNARILAAKAAGEPVPVFEGIGAVWSAVAKARGTN